MWEVKGGQNTGVSMKHEGSVSERTSVKKLLPPQAMRGIWLGMRGHVRSYVTLAIIGSITMIDDDDDDDDHEYVIYYDMNTHWQVAAT
jgi:hypothetical protein